MTINLTQAASNNSWQVLFNLVNTMAGIVSANAVTADATANGSVTIGNSYFLGIFATSNLVANTVRGGNNSVSGPLYVSSNVIINSSSQLVLGTFTTNSTVLTTGTLSLNATTLFGGNSTVNTTVNTSAISTVGVTANNISALGNTLTFLSNVDVTNLSVNSISSDSGTVTFNSNVVISNLSVGNISYTAISLPSGQISSLAQTVTNTSLFNLDSFPFGTYRTGEYTLTLSDFTTGQYQISKFLVTTNGSNVFSTETGLNTNTTVGVISTTINATHVILQAQTISSSNAAIKGTRILTVV